MHTFIYRVTKFRLASEVEGLSDTLESPESVPVCLMRIAVYKEKEIGDKKPEQRVSSCKSPFHVFNEKWCVIMKLSD